MIKGYEYLDFKGQELTKGRIPIDIYPNKEDAFKEMANEMVEEIVKNNKNHRKTLFICPLGPVGQYKYFVETVNKEKISLHDVTFINMDEYMKNDHELVDENDFLSFRRIMYIECYNKIDSKLIMPVEQRIFPNPTNRKLIEETIKNHGGVDICFGGIGITGHMAFNEPPREGDPISIEDYSNLSVRVAQISEETRVTNSMNEYHGAYYIMPKYCVTIGMKQILESKKVRLFCFRDWHRSVVRRASFGEVSVFFPASLLQNHKDARIGISIEVAE
jgi:glucosamine-6-phosphate deaminase